MTNDAPPWWTGDYEDPFDDQLQQYIHEAVAKLRKRGRSPMECIEILSEDVKGCPISHLEHRRKTHLFRAKETDSAGC